MLGKHRRFWIVRKTIEAVAGIETVMNTVELLLGAGRFAYLTLACQSKRFLVHRKIVRSKSPVWTAATDGSFKVRMCSQNISLNTHIMCRKLRRRRSQWTSSMHLLYNLRSRICTLAVIRTLHLRTNPTQCLGDSHRSCWKASSSSKEQSQSSQSKLLCGSLVVGRGENCHFNDSDASLLLGRVEVHISGTL
jgi:hypothetical protein